ncbi:MAG TPA: site-2 protease family protein [Candidatus Brocadiales bacterium]|nr:site-2 protease family protein [Candidatus Brocadiales bacterium]
MRKIKLPKGAINVALFIATIISTCFISPLYSAAIITILLAHELGHFFMCKKHGVESTLPYFIPFPFSPFGTFGAVIRMKGRMPNKQALFDIGVAGPLAGLFFAIPAIIIGLSLSTTHPVEEVTAGKGFMHLGEPLLFSFISKIIFGNISDNVDIVLHPIAYAGWTGLFVTALNLLPVGQLDGGHVMYALLGRKSEFIYKIGILLFCVFTVLWYHGWILMTILLLLFGFQHPAPVDETTGLDSRRKLLGIIMFIVFVLSFTPEPISFK